VAPSKKKEKEMDYRNESTLGEALRLHEKMVRQELAANTAVYHLNQAVSKLPESLMSEYIRISTDNQEKIENSWHVRNRRQQALTNPIINRDMFRLGI